MNKRMLALAGLFFMFVIVWQIPVQVSLGARFVNGPTWPVEQTR